MAKLPVDPIAVAQIFTVTHIHWGGACTAGHHDPSCSEFGLELSCVQQDKTVRHTEVRFPAICTHLAKTRS